MEQARTEGRRLVCSLGHPIVSVGERVLRTWPARFPEGKVLWADADGDTVHWETGEGLFLDCEVAGCEPHALPADWELTYEPPELRAAADARRWEAPPGAG